MRLTNFIIVFFIAIIANAQSDDLEISQKTSAVVDSIKNLSSRLFLILKVTDGVQVFIISGICLCTKLLLYRN